MKYRLLIRPDAELDIQAAFEWYETHASGLGSEFVRAVDVCLSGLGRNPLAYPLVYRQVRRAMLRRFPYNILYVLDQQNIAVVACYHSKRDPKSWQNRL